MRIDIVSVFVVPLRPSECLGVVIAGRHGARLTLIGARLGDFLTRLAHSFAARYHHVELVLSFFLSFLTDDFVPLAVPFVVAVNCVLL